MRQLREFAQHKAEFDQLHVRVIAISVDDRSGAQQAYQAGQKQFTILSDEGAKVIRQYGLLHEKGASGQDIALRTTLYIDADGKEVWRRVSEAVPDIPAAEEILGRIKASQSK